MSFNFVTARVALKLIALLVTASTVGCGVSFKPGFSLDDKNYFSSRPYIALQTNTGAYSLRWQYGTMGFFFQPQAKVVDSQLVFTLRATSSSGALAGQSGERPIDDPLEIKALRSRGAFWLEPDGRMIPLFTEGDKPTGDH